MIKKDLCRPEIRRRISHVTIRKSFSVEVRANVKGLRHEFIGVYEERCADRTTRAERRLRKYIGEVTGGQIICLFKKNFY